MRRIVADVAAGRYSDLHLAAFNAAGAGERMDLQETIALNRAMIDVGTRLRWPGSPIVDKHCVGGLPGNRTTLLVVPIIAALGLVMPKKSSRAITSPPGTADTMEMLAPVDLTLDAMRTVVEKEGACIAWGGSIRLSPADDILIRVERPLDIDSEGQLVASVLSKKAAAGSEHVLLDLPVGPTAKVRSAEAATTLSRRLKEVGSAIGLRVRCVQTDGSQPVGRGMAPRSRHMMCWPSCAAKRRRLPTCVVARSTWQEPCWRWWIRHPRVPASRRPRQCSTTGAPWASSRRSARPREASVSRVGAHRSPRAFKFARQRACHRQPAHRAFAKLAGAPASRTAGLRMRVTL